MSSNNSLLKSCRYYHGEDKNPYIRTDAGFLLWGYERRWVRSAHKPSEANLSNYMRDGLSDFRKDDGIPISLKVLLYERYNHWMGCGLDFSNDPDGFRKWFNEAYPR